MRALQVKESDPDYLEPQRFKTYVRGWGKFFLQMYCDDDITPYVHSMFTENFFFMMMMNHNFSQYIGNKNSFKEKTI